MDKKFKFGQDTIKYNEYPPFAENMISSAFVKQLVGAFNNEAPEMSFDESWKVFAKSPSQPKDNIKYMMAKKQRKGFPIIELMGFAEFEGVTAAACWEAMENHKIRLGWDGNMTEFRCIEILGHAEDGDAWHEVCYSKTKFPFPLAARDCSYNKYIKIDQKQGIFFCVWRPCSHPQTPKQRKVTRSWSYGAQLMCQLPGNKMRVWQAGCGDPKGSIPAWLINIAMPKLAVSGIRVLRSKAEEVQKFVTDYKALKPSLSLQLPIKNVAKKDNENASANEGGAPAAPSLPHANIDEVTQSNSGKDSAQP